MPTKDEWDKKKETIRQLWLVQGQTLLEVSYSLAALGFDATERQIEYRIRDCWGFKKRLPESSIILKEPQDNPRQDNPDIMRQMEHQLIPAEANVLWSDCNATMPCATTRSAPTTGDLLPRSHTNNRDRVFHDVQARYNRLDSTMLIDRDVGPVYDPILIQGNITHFATSTTTNAASLDPQYNFSEQAEMWFHPPMLHPVRRQTKASTNHVANDNDIQHGSTASKDDTEYPASPWYGESS